MSVTTPNGEGATRSVQLAVTYNATAESLGGAPDCADAALMWVLLALQLSTRATSTTAPRSFVILRPRHATQALASAPPLASARPSASTFRRCQELGAATEGSVL